MIGATLGAGIGRLNGDYGLMIDALLSARVVTADGQTLEVSDTSNANLFWGIRGAGANLGVLTSATYQLHPLIDRGNAASVDMLFSAEKNVSYFDTLAKLRLSSGLSIETLMMYNSSLDEVSSSTDVEIRSCRSHLSREDATHGGCGVFRPGEGSP